MDTGAVATTGRVVADNTAVYQQRLSARGKHTSAANQAGIALNRATAHDGSISLQINAAAKGIGHRLGGLIIGDQTIERHGIGRGFIETDPAAITISRITADFAITQ